MKLLAAVPVSKNGKPIGLLHLAFCDDGGAWAWPLCGAQLNRYQTHKVSDRIPPALAKVERCPCCYARADIMREAYEKEQRSDKP